MQLPEGERFALDRAFRREVLETSLVEPNNNYGRVRFEQYALENEAGPVGWDALPVWNPLARSATVADIGRFTADPYRSSTPEEGVLVPMLSEDAADWSSELGQGELIELGRRAFAEWPVQLNATMASLMESEELLRDHGVWIEAKDGVGEAGEGRVGGLVRVALADGTERFAITCSTCHSRVDDGRLFLGRSNTAFDFGLAKYREAVRNGGPTNDRLEELLEWGPGQADVTSDDALDPTAIPDLRAVCYQRHLHWAGGIKNSVAALAVRIDTQLTAGSGNVVRAPRQIPYAIATFLWSLGDEKLQRDAAPPDPAGAALFEEHCAECHRADGTVAGLVPVEDIGTDPTVALAPGRGTGFYRVPSLWAVADRRQLMHDGKLDSLEAMFDPARLSEVPGHEHGLDLSLAERTALLTFVRGIGADRN